MVLHLKIERLIQLNMAAQTGRPLIRPSHYPDAKIVVGRLIGRGHSDNPATLLKINNLTFDLKSLCGFVPVAPRRISYADGHTGILIACI
jgi:hypothetical protein